MGETGMQAAEMAALDWIQTNCRTAFLDWLMPAVSALCDHGESWIALAAALLLTKKYRRTGAVVALALLVADAVLVVLALTHPVVRLYAIPLGVSAPVAAVVAWLSFSRGKCARDLHVFDEYYVRVQDLLMSKERLESEIGVCRRRVDELRGKLNSTIGSFNKNLANDIPGGFVRELFAPLDGMISGYLADISKFSAEIEKAFNAALAEF